jgi:hypothetical protein
MYILVSVTDPLLTKSGLYCKVAVVTILQLYIVGIGAPRGLIGKSVRCRHGPATVMRSKPMLCH